MDTSKNRKWRWVVGIPVGIIFSLVILSSTGGNMTQLKHEISI